MIIVLGLVLLIAAVVVGVAGYSLTPTAESAEACDGPTGSARHSNGP